MTPVGTFGDGTLAITQRGNTVTQRAGGVDGHTGGAATTNSCRRPGGSPMLQTTERSPPELQGNTQWRSDPLIKRHIIPFLCCKLVLQGDQESKVRGGWTPYQVAGPPLPGLHEKVWWGGHHALYGIKRRKKPQIALTCASIFF